MRKIKISVVIPTHNSWSTLKDCIESIQSQLLKPSEILVIDNASTDNTAKNVRKHFPSVKLVHLYKNTGVTGGRNKGIEKANKSSDYVCFFDHDMVADKNMLEKLFEVAKKRKEVGIVTPKIYYWLNKDRIWSAGTSINLLTGQVLFRGGKDRGQYDSTEEVQIAPATMLVKQSVMRKIGGFDEKYYATYEDSDFCLRAKKAGYDTYYAPEAVAWHKISPDSSDERKRLLKRSYYVARNRIYFMEDHARYFWIFLFLSPVYFAYHLKLVFLERNASGLKSYMRGFMDGIRREVLVRRLMPHIPFTRLEILKRQIGDGQKTILDIGCGNGFLMDILNTAREWKVDGIDAYAFDAKRAASTGAYSQIKIGDIRKVNSYFRKKYDVVFCSQVLEHLEKKDALKLITAMEKLGKKIVIATPRNFLKKDKPHEDEGDNPYQIHKSAWSIADYRVRGYLVRGRGVNFLFGDSGIANKSIFKHRALMPLSYFTFQVVAYLLSPLVYYFPSFSTGLLAVKIVKP